VSSSTAPLPLLLELEIIINNHTPVGIPSVTTGVPAFRTGF
jgi:hypothetical protein